MSSFTPSGAGGLIPTVNLAASTTLATVSVDMADAGTEYQFILPTGTKQYIVRLESNIGFYVLSSSGGVEIPIPWCCTYAESDLNLSAPITTYIKASLAAQRAVIRYWT